MENLLLSALCIAPDDLFILEFIQHTTSLAIRHSAFNAPHILMTLCEQLYPHRPAERRSNETIFVIDVLRRARTVPTGRGVEVICVEKFFDDHVVKKSGV